MQEEAEKEEWREEGRERGRERDGWREGEKIRRGRVMKDWMVSLKDGEK